MSIITRKQFTAIRKKHKGRKIVYVSGTFDLIHANHVGFFEKAKKQGDYLVVGVGPDADIKNNKGGGRPILDEIVRLKMVDSLRIVDYCFLTKKTPKNQNSQIGLIEILEILRPDIYYVNSDASEIDFRQRACKQLGVLLIITPPYKKYDLSTTKIIEKIKAS